MKKLLIKSVFVFSMILMASCSSSGNDPAELAETTIRMTVNGNAITFTESQITVTTTTNGGINGGPTVSILGAISNLQIVRITLEEGTTGSNSLEAFEFFDSTAGISVQYVPNGNVVSTCGNGTTNSTGTFVVNTNDGSTASGTFSLNLEDCVGGTIQSTLITNGTFNVNY